MFGLWFILSTRWPLASVQAVLSLLLSVLSSIGIFILSRLCWQHATLHLTKQRDVPVVSLLTLTSIGEAFEVLWFLKFKSLTMKRYRHLLIQSLVIFGLSVTAILSGPIAKFGSRQGHTFVPIETPGLLAKTGQDSMTESDGTWTQIKNRLEEAEFPADQLLDFLPITTEPWVYKHGDWNNTWHVKCNYDPVTPITLSATGNYSGDYIDELPGLYEIVPRPFLENYTSWGENLDMQQVGDMVKDVLMFWVITMQPIHGEKSSEEISMGLMISAVHLHDGPMAPSNSTGLFGIGPIGSSSYTRAICNLDRSPSAINATYISEPNLEDPTQDTFAAALEAHYHANYLHQLFIGQSVWVPTGEDMFRLYQAYTVSKDTQEYLKVTRLISVRTATVDLSVIFTAILILFASLIITGSIYHSFFLLRHSANVTQMPESKLDWLLQSLREAERITGATQFGGRRQSSGTRRSQKPSLGLQIITGHSDCMNMDTRWPEKYCCGKT